MTASPKFISLDGPDGAGKSVQCQRLAEWLRERGLEIAACRDPGSTPLGERIRSLLLEPHGAPIASATEMLLYMAARAQLVAEIIRPALAAGKTVISDRFLLANVVYQGHAGGLDPDELWRIGRVATQGLEPDLTIVLDVPPDVAAARIERERDRMELRGDEFHRRVREGFLTEASRRPRGIVVIDASPPLDEVQAAIQSAVARIIDV